MKCVNEVRCDKRKSAGKLWARRNAEGPIEIGGGDIDLGNDPKNVLCPTARVLDSAAPNIFL